MVHTAPSSTMGRGLRTLLSWSDSYGRRHWSIIAISVKENWSSWRAGWDTVQCLFSNIAYFNISKYCCGLVVQGNISMLCSALGIYYIFIYLLLARTVTVDWAIGCVFSLRRLNLTLFISSWLYAVYSDHIKNGGCVDPVRYASPSFRNVPHAAPYTHPGGWRGGKGENKETKGTDESRSTAWSWQANCKAVQGRISGIIVQEGRIIL